jgi:hypothetical protein
MEHGGWHDGICHTAILHPATPDGVWGSELFAIVVPQYRLFQSIALNTTAPHCDRT